MNIMAKSKSTETTTATVKTAAAAATTADTTAKTTTAAKEAEKATATKAAESVAEAPAATTKKTAAKKTTTKTAAKSTTTKKTTAKKAEIKSRVAVQYGGKEIFTDNLLEEVKKVWVEQFEGKLSEIKTIELYIKSEESKAYFVVNGLSNGNYFIYL